MMPSGNKTERNMICTKLCGEICLAVLPPSPGDIWQCLDIPGCYNKGGGVLLPVSSG